jgi:hypothetical protein
MEIKGGSLSATYNENGKLISVIEKNILLFIYSVYKTQVGKLLIICTPKRGRYFINKKSKKEKTSVN